MKKRNQKITSLAMAAMLALPASMGFKSQQVNAAQGNAVNRNRNAVVKATDDYVANYLEQKYGIKQDTDNKNLGAAKDPNQEVRVIVELQAKPVLKDAKLDLKNKLSVNATIASKKTEINSIKAAQAKAISQATTVAKGAKVRNTYTYLFNGFSMNVKRGQIANLKKIPGVKAVKEAKLYQKDMSTAKNLTQAYSTWKDYGLKGEGMVVAIVDTGIDSSHKDMRITTDKKKLNKDNALLPGDIGQYYTDKVPYGYNFADGNNEVIDTTDSMHGMHVAGIVGANGTAAEVKENKAIEGVAPECQLLAMKVFPNDPNNPYASSDDIAAAIESSVEHGADVINMSLGATAGFQDPEDVEQIAVKNAVDNGVMCVISAGNSYYSTYGVKVPGVNDIGVAGTPGITRDSLCVASYENTNITCTGLDYTGEDKPMGYYTSEVDPVGVLKGEFSLVDCGIGQVSDFTGKDLKGKIALIQRGTLDFIVKKKNAQAAGAAGVIVYNRDGIEDYISMATDPSITIPAVFVPYSDGMKLKNGIATGIKVSFNGKITTGVNIADKDMSDFTSWGFTTNMEFKPEVSAPGGKIYSTLNNNKYGIKSGTSMAAPHTAGAEALVLQAFKTSRPDLKGRALVDFAKADTINTCLPEMDKLHPTVPFSPRRQGAGLIQIEDAIKNKVMATDEAGNAAVSLKEIGNVKEMTLKLHNYGTTDAVYKLDNMGGAYTDYNQDFVDMPYDMKAEGVTVGFDNETVTVPANGDATVKVTIKMADAFKTQQFVEGYVRFVSQDTAKPSLTVPYIGYYGQWDKEANVDAPIWDGDNTILTLTTLMSKMEDGNYYLGYTGKDKYNKPVINPNNIAISPNGDGTFDNVLPQVAFLRSCKNVVVEVLDKDKNVIRTVDMENNVNKTHVNNNGKRIYTTMDSAIWDGTVYDAAAGKYVSAPEGQYYVKLRSTLDYASAKEQVFEMPVKVDLQAPAVKFVSNPMVSQASYTVKWIASDSLSGISIDTPQVFLNGTELKDAKINKDANGVYSCDVKLAAGKNKIKVTTSDNAENQGIGEYNVDLLSITFDKLFNNIEVTQNPFTVTGKINVPVKSITINGKEATIDNQKLTFSAAVPFAQGLNRAPIIVKDFNDNVVWANTWKVYCDSIAPEIKLTSPTVAADGAIHATSNTVTLAGTVKDNTYGVRFFINGNQVVNGVFQSGKGGEKSFTYNLNVSGNSFVELKAIDKYGNVTIQTIKVVYEKPVSPSSIKAIKNIRAILR